MDYNLLFTIAAGRVACGVVTTVLHHLISAVSFPLNSRINQFYSVHLFHSMARLDVPTFDNDATQRQLQNVAQPATGFGPSGSSSVAWTTVRNILRIFSTAVQFIAQIGVVSHILMTQRDGHILAGLTLVCSLLQWRNWGGWGGPMSSLSSESRRHCLIVVHLLTVF